MPLRSRPRKTKIVATIGPASDTPEKLQDMIRAGMNVARLNLSHGTLTEHKDRLERIREDGDLRQDLQHPDPLDHDPSGDVDQVGQREESGLEPRGNPFP